MSSKHSTSVRRSMLAFLFAIGLTSAALAETKPVNMAFSDPGNSADASVTIQFQDTTKDIHDPNSYRYVDVTIPANSNAQQKRDAIARKLRTSGYTVNDVGDNGLTMPFIDSKVRVYFYNYGTMEHDVMTCAAPAAGAVQFTGFFEPFTPTRQPAIFTAGIVTDVGELSATISAQELNFQTDGPIICQALFQRLAPRAPQYGAQINYAGDRLEVYFDPAYTVTQGGVIWGTTSPSEGCSGNLTLELPQLALSVDGLVAGGRVTLTCEGDRPAEEVSFYYSFTTGNTFIASLNVTLDLQNPIFIGRARADSNGVATLVRTVPRNARGATVHFQAAAFEKLSPVVTERVR